MMPLESAAAERSKARLAESLGDLLHVPQPKEIADKHFVRTAPDVTGGYRERRRCIGRVADGSDTELCTYG
jgi:hypothetical protein